MSFMYILHVLHYLFNVTFDVQENPAGPSIIVNKKSKVDMITLGKGEEKNMLVWFFPAGASDEIKAARLQRRNFRLSLKCAEKKGYNKQRFSKIIQVFVILH